MSSFARGSSDIYLVFLHIADQLRSTGEGLEREWNDLLPGLATLVHWFGKGDEKLAIADTLMESLSGGISPKNLRAGIAAAIGKNLIVRPHKVADFKRIVKLPDDLSIKEWRWWSSLIESASGEERARLERDLRPFLNCTVWQRELLLYAQRRYLSLQFPDYDPSRKDLWENQNRPWDFDHIHASAYFYNRKAGDYADFCRQWGNTIGNLRAWPFQENRSDRKDTAKKKLQGRPNELEWSLIETADELDHFSSGDDSLTDHTKAYALYNAIQNRLIRIYKDWYESTGIELLLSTQGEAQTS